MTAPKISVVSRARRQRNEHGDRQRAGEIDDRQDIALRHAVAEIAGRQRADDVEQADGGQRPAADLGGKPAVDQIGRQMHGDEGELEAAGEEAEHQQHIAAMAEGLRHGLAKRLRRHRHRRRCAAAARRRQRNRQRQNEHASRRRRSSAPSASRICPSAPRRSANRGTGRTNRRRCRRRRRANASFAGSSLPKAPITRLNEQPDSPSPINTPAVRSSAPGVVACAISARPEAYKRGADHHDAAGAETVGNAAGETAGRCPTTGSGWPAPIENTSRPQWCSCDSGVRKKPSEERGPKAIIAIRQPQTTTTMGVRQPTAAAAFPVAPCNDIAGLISGARSHSDAGGGGHIYGLPRPSQNELS